MSVPNKIVFPHKHPLFKKKETKRGVYYENSIYYYWFEFLKLNEKYKGTTRGVYLFASTNPFNQLIKIKSQNQYNQINQSDYTVIAVPNSIDKKFAIEQVRRLTKNNKKFNYQAKYKFKDKTFKIETLKKNLKYLKLRKQFNVNWKAAVAAYNKNIINIDNDGKIYFNQLANRCERQIKIVYKKFIG